MEKKHLNVVCAVIHDGDKILCTQRLRKGPNYIAEHWEFGVAKSMKEKVITRLCVVKYLRKWTGTSMSEQNLGVLNMTIQTFQSALLPMTVWRMTMILSFSNILIPAG